MTTLVVGRGLLGRSLLAELRRTGRPVAEVSVPWSDPDAAHTALLDAAAAVGGRGRPWRLAWCAGAGVIATGPEVLAAESALFERVLTDLPVVPDTFFLASSVGGAYGAAPAAPPFTEASPTGAGSPYGVTKLAMEGLTGLLAARGSRVAVARIANLYGPGQNLTKPQGLVSQLCLSQVTGRPLGIYASLDTVRDYVFAPDCAAMVIGLMDAVGAESAGTTVVKILASGRAQSIASLIGECHRVFRHRPRVSFRPPAGQSADLRVRSEVLMGLDALARTPIAVGLTATARDITHQLSTGDLSPLMLASATS